METLPALGELLNLGANGVMLTMLWLIWKAYQLEVMTHLEDLRQRDDDRA